MEIASGTRKKMMITLSVSIAEKNFKRVQTINTDVLFVKRKPIEPQHVRGREGTEDVRITVQVKKVKNV